VQRHDCVAGGHDRPVDGMARVVAGLERLERRGCPPRSCARARSGRFAAQRSPDTGRGPRLRGRSAGLRPRRAGASRSSAPRGPVHVLRRLRAIAARKAKATVVLSRQAAVPPPSCRRCPQDTTRGPASASRGSRLRRARRSGPGLGISSCSGMELSNVVIGLPWDLRPVLLRLLRANVGGEGDLSPSRVVIWPG
jgi:hypothetical protein